MFVTLSVLKPLTSRLVKLEQLSNILPIFITSDVLRFSIPLIDVSLDIP